ncbi:MAG: ATP-binding protein [Aggregatilineales bacterium]
MKVATLFAPDASVEVRNLAHLRLCLAALDAHLRRAVARARAAGLKPDEYQGLYIDDSTIDILLERGVDAGLWPDGMGDEMLNGNGPAPLPIPEPISDYDVTSLPSIEENAPLDHPFRLLRLAQLFDLTPLERSAVLIALAPEFDRRYERLYSYLQDDVTRRRAGVELVLNLLADSFPERVALRRLFASNAALFHNELITLIPDPTQREPTLLSHFLKIDGRIVEFVLGQDVIDPRVSSAVERLSPTGTLDDLPLPAAQRDGLRRALSLTPVFYFHGTYGAGMRETALALCSETGSPLVVVDLIRLAALTGESSGTSTPTNAPIVANAGMERLARLAFREGLLAGGALLLENWQAVLDNRHAPPDWLMHAVLDFPNLVILSGTEVWEPHAVERDRPVLGLAFEVPGFDDRLALWQRYIGPTRLALEELADKFRLTGGQIRDATRTARDLAAWRGEPEPTLADLYTGSRAHSNRKLSKLAQKVALRYTWADIVLPDDRLMQLREMCNQLQFGHRVYEEWGFGNKLANARGLTALFAGVSGTGKTMSADVIAGALSLDCYKIDLSTVVSKYIGETEKNLSSIFDEAEQSNAILFFDEADALFGKRSEVKDAHDRYANIETGYLLQRMEAYEGITILATNLRQNLDEAFTRRLDFLIDFPFPEAPDRERIWRVTFPADAPLSADVDFGALAEHYRLAGGNIRNAVMAAAFLAASDGKPQIGMRHLLHAIKREYQKMGKLISDDLLARFGESE